jgi:hypothetical protein
MPVLEPTNLINVVITDAQGYSATTDAYFVADQDLTILDLYTVVGVWLGRLQDACGGRIVTAQVRLGIDVSPYADKAIEDTAMTTSGASLRFHNDQDSLPWNFVIPAVSVSVISDGGPDFTSGATLDRLASQMDGLDATIDGFTFASNRGGALTPGVSGFLSARKRNQLARRKSIRVVP